MRRLTFVGPGQVEWREAPEPRIADGGQAVVRPLVIGRCDLDQGYVLGMLPLAGGEPIGHEMVGEVIEVGDAVRRFKPGDRVITPAQISCGLCANCRRGLTGRCTSVPFGASFGMGRAGGYGCLAADRVLVPFADAMLFPLPPQADPRDWIGFADMAQDGWRAVAPALAERPGGRVLVIGGFPQVIGVYAAAIAVGLGASAVDFYDDDEVRLVEAGRFGAQILRRGVQEPERAYDIVVDASVEDRALTEAFRFCAPGGTVASVAIHLGGGGPIPTIEAYHKGVTWRTGRPDCRANMEACAALCATGRFRPERLTTDFHRWEDAPEAWMSGALRTAAWRT